MTEREALAALKSTDADAAARAETALWELWCRCPSPELAAIFRAGIEAIDRQDLPQAQNAFSRIIERAPDFAEAWNKRATVRYLARDWVAAIDDCRETLARNPNHFGALSGQGLCHMALGQHREAAALFRRALDVHPHLAAVRGNLQAALAEAVRGNGQSP